ncbi:hypothetical protein [Aquimarina litoralis]|uniref:hypothetical protein n=1 Tax=Aquimarina litoralis TaxID=584605 RepID=UPI001C5666A9|nr:hypothetical protein [Aquimarina litoralis]MBW1299018.1 hypothetical protein [Aquimarina litoralis]
MNKIRTYKIIIISLLALNMIMIAFFLITKQQPKHKASANDIRSEIIKTLNLNDQQTALFMELADEHKQAMQEINEQKATLLYPYFESLADSSISISKDDIIFQLQQSEKKKIAYTYQHFKEIKKILTKEQMPYFKSFIAKITRRLIDK